MKFIKLFLVVMALTAFTGTLAFAGPEDDEKPAAAAGTGQMKKKVPCQSGSDRVSSGKAEKGDSKEAGDSSTAGAAKH